MLFSSMLCFVQIITFVLSLPEKGRHKRLQTVLMKASEPMDNKLMAAH